MNKKELIAKLLEQLSEEELNGLLKDVIEDPTEESQPQHTHKIKESNHSNRRRGMGRRKHQINEEEEYPVKNKRNRRKNPRRVSKGKQCRVEPINTNQQRKNKFTEFIQDVALDPTEQQELEEAARADTVRKQKPFRMKKRQSTLIDVVCRVCGAEETISASLVGGNPNRYKCNDCSTTACD